MTERKPEGQVDEAREGTRSIEVRRFSPGGGLVVDESADVVAETLLSVWIEDSGRYVLACSPSDTEALAVGFAFSEGLIMSRDDILNLGPHPDDPDAIEMKLRDPKQDIPGRNLLMTSSCGLCGTRNLEKYLLGEMSCELTLEIRSSLLLDVAREMRSRQRLFSRTGGTHAAAVFQGDGQIVAFAEDIGRHNALDKVIGKRLQTGESARGCGVMLSGRVSFEIVAKAARAGLELLGAVSAPTALAVEVADRCQITLCGFVREDRLSAFTHPGRVKP